MIALVSDVTHGGAAIACRRLSDALKERDVPRKWVAFSGEVVEDCTILNAWPDIGELIVERLLMGLGVDDYRRRRISLKMHNDRMLRCIRSLKGVKGVNFHNIHGSMDTRVIEGISKKLPVVITMHDMWYLTGYCCHSIDCDVYEEGCGRFCPQWGKWRGKTEDDAAKGWHRRQLSYLRSRGHIAFVTPSEWLRRKAVKRLGGLGEVYLIRNSLDLDVFRPRGLKRMVKECLGLPLEGSIVMTSSHWIGDKMKGMGILEEASRLLSASGMHHTVVAVGERLRGDKRHSGWLMTDHIRDDVLMSLYYSAADLFVLPSLAENYPNTLCESVACGTPVVAFDVGGCPEIVKDGVTGALAKAGQATSLADAMRRILTVSDVRYNELQFNCREYAERELKPACQADAYAKVFQSIGMGL